MSESLRKRRGRPLSRAPLDAMLGGHIMRPPAGGSSTSGTNSDSDPKTFKKPRDELEAQNSTKRPVCCSIAPAMQPDAQISPLKRYWPRHCTTGFEQPRGPKMRQCVILLLVAAMTTANFCTCLESLSTGIQIGHEARGQLVTQGPIGAKGSQPLAGGLCATGGCHDQLVVAARKQSPTGLITMITGSSAQPIRRAETVGARENVVIGSAPPRQQMANAPGRELMVAAASGMEPETAESKKKKKMMKKKKKMEKKHKEWKKGKKHKKKKYESKKKKGGSMKKKKGKKEKKKWGKEMKGHKKKGNFKKKKWGHKKKMKKGHKKGKKGHKMLKDKGHKKKGFKKVYHKEEWGKRKKWHDIKREKKWNTKQKKWKKKWHQEKGKKYKGKHMKKYKKENKHGKKYKKEKKSKWKKHKGEKFKKGHKKKKEEYSKKKEGGKKKKMKKEMKKMKKKKG